MGAADKVNIKQAEMTIMWAEIGSKIMCEAWNTILQAVFMKISCDIQKLVA